MSDHHHPHDKKAKKKAQLKKNRRLQEIFQVMRLQRAETERVDDLKEGLKPGREEKSQDEIWSEKVATVRNRLTDHRRTSKERWNRFAGTGGEGGRGL